MKLLAAFLTDLMIGDPDWIPTPHPIVLIGKAIAKGKEKVISSIYGKSFQKVLDKRKIREPEKEILGGGILHLLVVGGAYLVTDVLVKVARAIHPKFGDVTESFLIYQCLAGKCLKDEAEKVQKKLEEDDLPGARVQIGYLVGRDTACLSEEEVTKATVETVAENTADGVIAPMLYAAIGGAPLAMAYKAVNTLDSMVGYKNEENKYLGKISAKADDLWNFLPARISAFAMMIGAYWNKLDHKNAFRIFKRDRYNHLSPNSAQTESVTAGALHIQLGGTHDYFGKPVEKPTIGDLDRPAEPSDIEKTNKLMYSAAICTMGVITVVKLIRWLGKER